MSVPDPRPVRAFLERAHDRLATRLAGFATDEVRSLPVPEDDASAREQALEVLASIGEAGLFEVIGREDLRGCCLAREALAAASPLADAVFALQALSATPLLIARRSAGNGERSPGEVAGPWNEWLPSALSGEAMGAFAMTEREAGTDVASMRTRARREGDAYRLDGEKTLISNAGSADFYVVFASTRPAAGSRGISAFLVPADSAGLHYLGPQVMSAPHPLGEIGLEGCRVPVERRIGKEGEGFKIGMATLDRLRPTVGAAACGMAARALEEAVAHATRREQFGRPIAEFQLVRERLGRMSISLDAARLLVYRAAYERDLGADRITREAAAAKAFATEAAQEIVDQAVQIAGGRGVLANHPVDRLYRSIRALRIYEGTTEIQHLLVADALLREAGTSR